MMTRWSAVHHAYGPADDIPGLLARLTPDEADPSWDDLWSRLCHQGTVYPASFMALPELLALARRWPPSQRTAPLALAAAIVMAEDGAETTPADVLSALEESAQEAISAPGLDHSQVIDVVQAVLAFRGDRLWGRQLDRYADGELPAVCPRCTSEFYIVIGGGEYFVARDDYVRNPAAVRTPMEPTPHLPELGQWLLRVATATRDSLLARDVPYLFGAVACPGCGLSTDVPQAIAGAL